jgi:hypothetical protein
LFLCRIKDLNFISPAAKSVTRRYHRKKKENLFELQFFLKVSAAVADAAEENR